MSGVIADPGATSDAVSLAIGAALALLGILAFVVERLVFRVHATLSIEPSRGKRIELRFRSEADAVQRLREVAEAVERDGLVALASYRR